jgi:hypothetical protein
VDRICDSTLLPGETYVHDTLLSHSPRIFNADRRKLLFLHGKPNAHFI